jgi:hypothetical protein
MTLADFSRTLEGGTLSASLTCFSAIEQMSGEKTKK